MKKTLLRNNLRKMHGNPLQPKTNYSQSPTHKKLLKKIELTQREAPNQYELSLQDNLVFQKPQEEVVDFRVEIERRFQKSIANHTYVFPRNKEDDSEDMLDNSTSSLEGSMDSLRHVTVYELVSQNKKKARPAKGIYKTQDGYTISGRDTHSYRAKEATDYRIRTEPDQGVDSDEDHDVENPATPIEIRIRDKSSTTYKNLINMLEKQLNRPSSTIPTAKKQAEAHIHDENHVRDEQTVGGYQPQIQIKDAKVVNKDKRPVTNLGVRNPNLTKDESQRSIGYYIGKTRLGDPDAKGIDKSESVLSFHDTSEKVVKKTTKTPDASQRLKMQAREKVSALMESSQNGESMLSLDSRLSPNSKKAANDLSRVSMESKKKVYSMANASLLRALTPKCMANKNLANWKDSASKGLKPKAQGENGVVSQTPSSSLYQKAQDDVLNGKLRVSTQKVSKKPVTNENEIQREDKDDHLKTSDAKGINFTDFYGSPKGHISKLSPSLSHTMYNNFTKVRNMRKMEGSTGEKSSERQSGYVSYDINGKKSINNSSSKPAFKLDLSNRIQKQRDLLSSTRTRDNQSKEKSSDMMSIDSILKTSYDMHNHSLVRNASKQAEISKRKLGVTPKGNLSKNSLLA